MDKKLAELVMWSQQIDRRHLHMIFAVLALTVLVVGVGAPSDGGGAGRAMMGLLHHHVK